MRSNVPEYHAEAPRSLTETLQALKKAPGHWTLLAGGTDLMVVYEAGQLAARNFLSIWGLPELKGIKVDVDFVELGALTTFSDVQSHPILQKEFPNLCKAGFETGGLAIQNRGTLGGNIANASPAADSPPALLCYDAELRLVTAEGERRVAYDGFHIGYKKMLLKPGEVIASVRLPRVKGAREHFYRKVGTRLAQAISKVVLAATAVPVGGKLTKVRLALGSVAPVTLRCKKTEGILEGHALTRALIDQAIATILTEIQPIDDIRSTAEYRNTVTTNVLRQFLCGLG